MLQKRSIYSKPEEVSIFIIWLFFFLVTLFIILMVQLIILPYLVPAWHAGNGLLIGGDWLAFHQEAVKMAERIKVDGWSAWELWPKGWLPAGIAGAFYAITWPKPIVLAPLNAAVHALSAVLVMTIVAFFTKRRLFAFLAALPFTFFPSAMLWYTQIHRDGFNILGMLLFLYGMFLIFSTGRGKYMNIPGEVSGVIVGISGIFLIWLSRPHTLLIFLYAGLIIFILLSAYYLVAAAKKKCNWKSVLLKLTVFALLLFSMLPFASSGDVSKYQREPVIRSDDHNTLWAANFSAATPLGIARDDRVEKIKVEDFQWERTPFLPVRIDNQFYSIAVNRSVWFPISYGDSASGIDPEVSFNSAIDFVYYLPRALQIAFLAPFPTDWFGQGSYESTTFFRRVSALEMVFIYLMLIPLLYAAWLWRKKIELYILLFYCTVMMLPIVYSVPNLGTIYRYRYGYLMLLVSLAVAALCEFFVKRKGQDGENTDSSRV